MQGREKVKAKLVNRAVLNDCLKKPRDRETYTPANCLVEWPFKHMELYDCIEMEESQFYGRTRGQVMRMAHNYGNATGKKFSCRTAPHGAIYVERLK